MEVGGLDEESWLGPGGWVGGEETERDVLERSGEEGEGGWVGGQGVVLVGRGGVRGEVEEGGGGGGREEEGGERKGVREEATEGEGIGGVGDGGGARGGDLGWVGGWVGWEEGNEAVLLEGWVGGWERYLGGGVVEGRL